MEILTVDSVEFEVVRVGRGDFVMGSENFLFSESPPHLVSIRTDFFLGQYLVTQAQWQAVMGDNPSAFPESPDHPVDRVSWDDAIEFCGRLSMQGGQHIRLPSEAEWEYACRAGTQSDFFFGPWGPFADDSEVLRETRHALCEYAWFDLNSVDRTHRVGLKRPNPWGLHDMLGNLWEWCADVWHSDYEGAPNDGSPWLEDELRQSRRCLRGGAWNMNAFRCRSPYRSYDHRDCADKRFGFRIAMDTELSPATELHGEPSQPDK
jgi:eukaryotic-like serine/threonine-protein kinase